MPNSPFDEFTKRHELEADSFGWQQYRLLIQKPVEQFRFNPPTDFEAVPYLFFEILDLMNEYSIERLNGEGIQKITYPTFAQRRENIEINTLNEKVLYLKPSRVIRQIKAQL